MTTTSRSELFVHAPVPGTGYTFVGYIDEVSGGLVTDFKTTDDPLQYIEQQALSHQLPLMVWALKQMTGQEVHEVAYRIVQRPSIKWKEKQTWDEYLAECMDWFDKPSVTGQKIVNHRMPIEPGRVDEAVCWLHRVIDRLEFMKGLTLAPVRNESSCLARGRTCRFVQLCRVAHDARQHHAVKERWFEPKVPRAHPVELPEPLISYSQARELADCDQKWVYGYGWKIQKRREYEDDGEALSIGKLFHTLREVTAAEGMEFAEAAVMKYAPQFDDPVKDRKSDEMLAKAIAMNRVALNVWPVEGGA